MRETGVNVEYKRTLSQPQKAAAVFREVAKEMDRELLMLVTLDAKNQIIGVNIVSIGSLGTSIAHPREMAKLAILQNATSAIHGHNHPSGDTHPSQEDRQTHARMTAAFEILGIRLLDGIILGDDGFFSFTQGEEIPYE